mgnify:CR=1 FL=1
MKFRLSLLLFLVGHFAPCEMCSPVSETVFFVSCSYSRFSVRCDLQVLVDEKMRLLPFLKIVQSTILETLSNYFSCNWLSCNCKNSIEEIRVQRRGRKCKLSFIRFTKIAAMVNSQISGWITPENVYDCEGRILVFFFSVLSPSQQWLGGKKFRTPLEARVEGREVSSERLASFTSPWWIYDETWKFPESNIQDSSWRRRPPPLGNADSGLPGMSRKFSTFLSSKLPRGTWF